MVRASGVGSHPGEDSSALVDAIALVVGELAREQDGWNGVPYLPEIPGRGPGADVVGRALAAVATDLDADLQPSGWRLVGTSTGRGGLDSSRARAHLGEDVERWAEALQGWTGPVKVQVCGPVSLAGTVWLPRGERVVIDPGATRDLVAALAEGTARHVQQVRRLLPDVSVVLQVDEPSWPGVLAGHLPTRSGWGRVPALELAFAQGHLRAVADAARAAGAVEVVAHCCADDPPVGELAACVDGVSVDLARIGSGRWEEVAQAVEGGTSFWAGTDSASPDAVAVPWQRIGLPLRGARALDSVTVTPSCGLAGSDPAQARAALARNRDLAAALAERAAA